MMSLNPFRSDALSRKRRTTKPASATRRETDLKVRLLEAAIRRPATAVESVVVNLLSRADETPVENLVALVADAFYRDELRMGAWAIDLGLFGSSLFVSEARRALEAGDGELWEIG